MLYHNNNNNNRFYRVLECCRRSCVDPGTHDIHIMAPLIWSLVHFCLLLFNLTVWLWPCLWPEEGRGMGIDVAPGKLLFSTAAGVFFLLLLLVAAASSVGLAVEEFVALAVLVMWRCLEFEKSWGKLSNMTKGLLSTGPYVACLACPSNV